MKFHRFLIVSALILSVSSCGLFDKKCNATYAINDGEKEADCIFITDQISGLWSQTGTWTSDSCGSGVVNRQVIITPNNNDSYYSYYYYYTSYVYGKAFFIPCLPTGAATDDCIAFLNSDLSTFSLNSVVHNTPLNQNWIITGDGVISDGLDSITVVYTGYCYSPTDTCHTSGSYFMVKQ